MEIPIAGNIILNIVAMHIVEEIVQILLANVYMLEDWTLVDVHM